MKAPEEGKKNTVPTDNRINLYIKDNDLSCIKESPGLIISTHYQIFRDAKHMVTKKIEEFKPVKHY